MTDHQFATIDGNEAAASVAYRTNEVIAIYPITPASMMGELADQWSTEQRPNIWGNVPAVIEMQSEGGAAGALHGALQTGSLATTFTASQGLLLMLPNMYKIAGELTPTVFHVAARALATSGLSIFGDHSDVMAARSTGWAMLCSENVQEAADFAAIAQAATLEARVPFLHFFDGFRTSHEIQKVEPIADRDLRAMIDERLVQAHRARGLSPESPFIRGTAHNPDTYFQAREASNPFYLHCPGIVQACMDRFARRTGRQYRLFDYSGAPDAERVIVVLGSAGETASETARALNARGEHVGVIRVRLFRPFSMTHLLDVLPRSVRSVAVLDRTKEPGSAGEPLYQDIVTAFAEAGRSIKVIGGRYGLASKEFTPAMVRAVFDELALPAPRNHFTVGIEDDVSGMSLTVDPSFTIEGPETVRAVFYGLGSDGTVGANKNSIKIIGTQTDLYAQGYFEYDSKKSGSVTVSHLRFGQSPIRAPYLVTSANFVGCHQFQFLERLEVVGSAAEGGTLLINAPFPSDEVWARIPRHVQVQINERKLRVFVIDANLVARGIGMGGRINTIMQACFFALSGVLPREAAIEAIKHSIVATYGKRGDAVVQNNFRAVDAALAHLHEISVPAVSDAYDGPVPVADSTPALVAALIAGHGDALPVSALPPDGTFQSGTARYEKRNIAAEIPVWDEAICIQCDKCVLVCPHAAIRAKVYASDGLDRPPATFKSARARFKEFPELTYSLQVAPEDCTGCGLCVEVCPVKNKQETRLKALNLQPQAPLREAERDNWNHFLRLPEADRTLLNVREVKDVGLLQPLFEFSGACAGCGETPYLKLISQLFGDRALIANATGCSSIYGGNLPTTPWTFNQDGRGPAWSNSLFEDNAEFGLGFRLSVDAQTAVARERLHALASRLDADLVGELLNADQSTESGIRRQRECVARLKDALGGSRDAAAIELASLADALVKRSVWIVGGDGWAYDIGYGGLDHVLASGHNVNVLVLDTEVYSNTGGQMSKSTPRAAVAKFAASGKHLPKKDLGLLATTYGSVYVARVAFGANDAQTVRALVEAEAFDGPSLVIAYSHCIAHGYDLRHGLDQQKRAVLSGYWPLFRFDPRHGMTLDSKPPSVPLEDYMYQEGRFRLLTQSEPEEAQRLLALAREDVQSRWRTYQQLASEVDAHVHA